MINKENLDQMLYNKNLNMLCSGGTMKSAIQAKQTTKKNHFFSSFHCICMETKATWLFSLDI